MDLRKIVKWLVFLLIVVVAWREGWPRLQAMLSGSFHTAAASVEDESLAETCIREATATVQAFGDGVSTYGRDRSDTAGWMRFAGRIQRRAGSARNLCDCPGEACSRAKAALVQLDSLIQRTDGMVRGSTDVVFNPATDMEEIYDKLDQAKSRLRDAAGGE